ncbi:MAG TPA: hypothetical protein VLV86_23300 [Vicinamibacterales bacterium]|nr:hypothetical protein [Vicinamibacterales bacterium]
MWSAEAVFVCALSLLGRSATSFPPTQLVERPPADVSPLAAAYTREGAPGIVLITSTSAFMAARRAPTPCSDIDAIREIAGVLAHEEWHVHNGRDEAGAYDAQLITLLSVGEDQDGALYHKVMRSKLAVLAAARRASRASVVARGPTPAPDRVGGR